MFGAPIPLMNGIRLKLLLYATDREPGMADDASL